MCPGIRPESPPGRQVGIPWLWTDGEMATALRGPCTLTSRKNVRSLEPQGIPEGSCKAVRVLLEGWTGQRSLEPGDISAKGPGRRGSRKGAWGMQALRPPGGGGCPRAELVLAADGRAPWALLQAGVLACGDPTSKV